MSQKNNRSAKEATDRIKHPNLKNWSIGIVLTCFIILVFSILVFFIDECKIPNVNHGCWGNFGNFFGGILVPILTALSVILLTKTLISQIQSNALISDSNNLTQFNELFKIMLEEYHSTIKKYTCTKEGNPNNSTRGKDVLRLLMDDILDKVEGTPDIDTRHKKAMDEFEKFYAEYLPIASLHFKLLYRIFSLVEDSDIPDLRKKEVAKIIRCQLSDQELFFLRYNAFSSYGEKMQDLINKYNILKHLQTLSTYEFAKYKKIINDEIAINATNKALYSIRQETVKLLNSGNGNNHSKEIELSKRYVVNLKVNEDKSYSMSVYCMEEVLSTEPIDNALDSLSNQKLLVPFLKDFATELFKYSNFEKYNDNFEIYSKGNSTDSYRGEQVPAYNVKMRNNSSFLRCSFGQNRH